MHPETLLTLDIERPAAGGRMLARHDGQVVLVWGAIPGERVTARVERSGKGVLYAETVDVTTASPDRRGVEADWRCGGSVLAHVSYPRQLTLKSEIIADAFRRIARAPLGSPPEVIGSPETGYRMRARLHVHGSAIGFYREGTHQLCDAGPTRQLLPETIDWIHAAQRTIDRHQLAGIAGLEIAENVPGDQRAVHLELHERVDPAPMAALAEGLAGLSARRADRQDAVRLAGLPVVGDVLHLRDNDSTSAVRLRREARAFFQGNRFLLESLVRHVAARVPAGPVIDLYAGVGLFGLSMVAAGADDVTLVEGDPVSGTDLSGNAEPFAGRVRVERRSVEAFLRGAGDRLSGATVIVDPPRTGLSKDALAGIVARTPARLVYVSCDAATLARDTRQLLDAGYGLADVTAFDLFPNTAHVETVAVFTRGPDQLAPPRV